jgi:hypothetical protein
VLVPAIKELMLCRRLKCSWTELQQMPEETVELWGAVIDGEQVAERQKAARMAAQPGS